MELRDKWMQETESKQQTKTKRINEATIETCYTENQRHNMRTNAIPNQKNIVTGIICCTFDESSSRVSKWNHQRILLNRLIQLQPWKEPASEENSKNQLKQLRKC